MATIATDASASSSGRPAAIVIGASSGIGAALAIRLAASGYRLGIAARRTDLLEAVAARMQTPALCRGIDLRDPEGARLQMRSLMDEMGGVELVVIAAGVGHENPTLLWPPEAETIAVNVAGFAAIATLAFEWFAAGGRGHLVGISSIAAIRGHGDAPAYGASKAFVASYLAALRQKAANRRLPICVTDIQAGFVDTAMAKGEGLFWVAPVELAAAQILATIRARRPHAYVTRRWRLIAWLLRAMPEWVYNRLA